MKKIASFQVLLLSVIQLFSQTVPVTLHFDTKNTSIKNVWLSAPAYGYDNVPYTDEDNDSILEITVGVPAGRFDYLPLPDNAYMWDPHNPKDYFDIADPSITYFLPLDGGMMKENRIRADLAFTAENPIIAGSIHLKVNDNEVANAEQFYSDEKRLLIYPNPPFLTEGENTVTLSYSTNKGSASATTTFTYHSLKLMCDTTTYYIPDCPLWGRVFDNPLPAMVYVKHNETVLEAPVNANGYFCVNTELVEGDNTVAVAATEPGLNNPVDQMVLHANLCPQFWVELNGSVNGNTATITTTAHDVELSNLTLQWSEENNPQSIGINAIDGSVSFTVPEKEGLYTVKLVSTDKLGKTYTARECLLVNENPHFLGLRERAPWNEDMVMYQIESGAFWGFANGFRFDDYEPVFKHLKSVGINTIWLTNLHQNGMICTNHFEFHKHSNETSGSKEDFKNFVQKAHEYGIKIIPQISFTHTAPLHSYLLQSYLNKDASVFSSFYRWEGEPGKSEVMTDPANGRNCVETNLDNEFTEEYFLRNLEFWIEEFDVDGVFYDCGNNAAYRSPDFMQKALERQKNKKPDFFVFSEGDATIQPYSLYYADGCYDWMLSVPWDSNKGFPGIFNQTTNVEDMDSVFMKVFQDSLLIKRTISDYNTRAYELWDYDREKLGLSMVMTAYGMPHIFMGNEIGSTNIWGPYAYVCDPENLKPLNTRLIKMRQEILGNYAVLTRLPNNSPQQVYSYISKGKEGTTLTVANLKPTTASVTINLSDNLFPEKITKWYEVMGDTDADLSSKNSVTIDLNKWESKVFVLNKTKSEIYTSPVDFEPVSVTFQINMKGIDVNHGGVSVVGNWSNWKEATQLSLVHDDIYAGTIIFETTGELQWRFANSIDVNDYDNYEYLGTECTKNYNRYVELPENDSTLAPVCFGKCETCLPIVNYTISSTVNPAQGGTISGAGTYSEGETVTIKATPNAGYKFVNWTNAGSIVSSNSSYSFLASENVTYTANFEEGAEEVILRHSYPFEDGTAADRIGDCDGTLHGGTIVGGVYKASSNGQYIELPATDIAINTFSSITLEAYITADADNTDATMMAYFGGNENGVGGNGVFMTPDRWTESRAAISCGNLAEPWNAEQGVTADPVSVGKKHHLVVLLSDTELSWYIDGVLVGSTVVSGNNKIANISTAHAWLCKGGYNNDPSWVGSIDEFNIYEGLLLPETIAKNASTWPVYTINNYTITATVNPLNSGAVTGVGTYEEDALVKLSANANSGYEFVNWTCADTVYSTQSVLVFGLYDDLNLVAHFKEIVSEKYTITTSATPAGTGTVTGAGTYDAGTLVTIIATPKDGFSFVNWTMLGEVISTSASYSFTVDKSAAYLAHFTKANSPVEVIFQVDMQNETISSGVYLRGSFNNWNSTEPLAKEGTVYYKTIELNPGETVEYKFVNGEQWEENIPSNCSYGSTGNRQLIVPEENIVLDAVCFNSCNTCDPDAVYELSSMVTLYPNPTTGKVIITGFTEPIHLKVNIYDIAGRLIDHCNYIAENKVQVDLSTYPKGFYQLQLDCELGVLNYKIQKK